jgi:hypothetical protein
LTGDMSIGLLSRTLSLSKQVVHDTDGELESAAGDGGYYKFHNR